MADVIVINKLDTAKKEDVDKIMKNIKTYNPKAIIVKAESPIFVEKPELIKDKKVLVVEDGPTLTHGEMKFGAGVVAANKFGAKELIDPRPYTVQSIRDTYEKYPHIGTLLPAMGYGEKQIRDLEATINNTPADLVIIATPINLGRLLKINKPSIRVKYELKEISEPNLEDIIKSKFNL